MNKDIPRYKITIDDEYSDGEKLGIEKIAHTANPAIKIKGVAFKEIKMEDADLHPNCRCQVIDGELETEPGACDYCLSVKKDMTFSSIKKMGFSDDLKMRIAAPLMVPGEIYRYDDEDGEYYIEFTTDEIEAIHKDFMKNLTNKGIYNEEHDNTKISDNSYLLEVLLVDSENKIKMIKDDYGIELPLYSLFTITQIENKEYYDYLVKNEMLGLSLEGFLGMKLTEQKNKKTGMKKDKKEIYELFKSFLKENDLEEKDLELETEVKDEELETEDKKEEELEVEEEVKVEVEEELETEDKKEEELEVEEEVEEEVKEVLTSEDILKLIQPTIDEVIEMIAEIKSSLIKDEELETEKKEFKMNSNDLKIRKIVNLSNLNR